MKKPKVVVFGCTKLSEEVIDNLLKYDEVEIVGIVTSPEAFTISYSKTPVRNYNFADLSRFQSQTRWVHVFDKSRSDASKQLQEKLHLSTVDVILVVGWYYMVPKVIREIAAYGAWGLHASMLPDYAGGAPVVWAMINQEKYTGISLFRLEDGVDDGPIIKQIRIEIEKDDYIEDVLKKVSHNSHIAIREALRAIPSVDFKVQPKGLKKIWPQRSPSDGEISSELNSEQAVAFIKAQSRPYPGAYIFINGIKVSIWRVQELYDVSTPGISFSFKCINGEVLVATDFSISNFLE